MSTERHDSHPFDAGVRELHRAAVEHVSAQSLGRLRSARRDLPLNFPGAQPWHWGTAALASAVLAVAIGMQLLPSSAPDPVAATSATLAATTEAASDYPASLAALDENPDLYMWLAAEFDPLALEQL